MPRWVVKICDPDGKRDRDECYGDWESPEAASQWATDNVPDHIRWHVHHLKYAHMFKREDWESRLPDFLASIGNPTRSLF